MSQIYNFIYFLGPPTGNNYTITGPGTPGMTGTLSEWTLNDLALSPNEAARLVLSGGGGTFIGNYAGTVGTDGAIFVSGGTRLLLSNTGGLTGTITADPTQTLLVCFLPGTLIATPEGEVAVESLSIGDAILTADGRAVPVRWIGRQTVTTLFGPPESRSPVVIEAGALAEAIPHSDLRVTADHALILDGIAVNAGALVNGTTIRRIPRAELGERYTVFHIETEGHEAILANGAPTETFVDNVARARFDNHAEYLALFGAESPVAEMALPRAASADRKSVV